MIIGIAGAGSIGCYTAGCLAAVGHDLRLLARARVAASVAAHGLRVSDCLGDRRVPAGALRVDTSPAVVADADAVLVTVKSHATRAIAAELAPHLRAGIAVASLQNGVTNRAVLRDVLPRQRVMSVVVPFNVVELAPAHYHKASEGHLIAQRGVSGPLTAALGAPGLDATTHRDIDAVLWGKLVLNLNNALNALSGLPLAAQLRDRRWRRVLAAQLDEALDILRRAGIRPARATRVPPRWAAHALRLPTPAFEWVAGALLRIDVTARSSMAEDLAAGRPTEVRFLQGAIAELAAAHGLVAPISERVLAAVERAERSAGAPPAIDPRALL